MGKAAITESQSAVDTPYQSLYNSIRCEQNQTAMTILQEYFAGLHHSFSCKTLRLESDNALVPKRKATKRRRCKPRNSRPDQNRWGESSGSSSKQKLASPVRLPRSSSADALDQMMEEKSAASAIHRVRGVSSWENIISCGQQSGNDSIQGSSTANFHWNSPLPSDHSPSRPTRTSSSSLRRSKSGGASDETGFDHRLQRSVPSADEFFSPLPTSNHPARIQSVFGDHPAPSPCESSISSTCSTSSESPMKLPSRKASLDEDQFLELA